MENPFEFHEEDAIIACVGDNGGTTDEDIRNGFKRTVELLTESLKTGSEFEDLLVYPIVANSFDGMYLIKKLKQRTTCLRILYGMKKCGQVTYAKQLSAALEQEGIELTL